MPFSSSLTRRSKCVEHLALRKGVCGIVFLLAAWLVVLSTTSAQASDERGYQAAHDLVLKQKWAEALPILKTLHESAPSSVLIGQDLANALVRNNRREEGMALFKKIGLPKQALVAGKSFITQDSFKIFQEGLNFLFTRRYPQACERFEKSLERDLGHQEILLRLVQCQVLAGSPDTALKSSELLIKIHGQAPEVLLWRGKAFALKNQWAEALPLLETAIKQLPESEIAPLVLAEIFAAQIPPLKKKAQETLETDLKRNPMHVAALLLLVKLRLQSTTHLEELQETRKLLQLAQSRIPQYTPPELELRDAEAMNEEVNLLNLAVKKTESRLQEELQQAALSTSS